MSTWRPIQEAFTAGEISPYFYAQQDSELYRHGLKRCRNMVPLTQGAATSRPGTQFLGQLEAIQFPVTNGRCIPIEISADTWAVAVMGGGGLSLLTGGSFTIDRQMVLNPEMNLGLAFWAVDTSGPIASAEPLAFAGDNYINMRAAGDNPDDPIGSSSTIQVSQSVNIDEVGLSDLSFEFKLTWGLGGQGSEAPFFVRIGTSAPGSTEILDERYEVDEDGESVRVSFTWAGSAGYTGPVYLELFGSGAIETLRFVDVSVDYFRCWVNGIVGDTSPVLDTPYLDEELDAVQFISSPFTLQTVFTHPNHTPQELTIEGADWVFRDINFDTDPGLDPDWGGDNGFPAACAAYQGRLVLAGSAGEPQTVWASESGDWYRLGLEEAPEANEPVWFTLAVRGAIRWVFGQKALLIGASNAEHEAVGVGTGILQAGDISAHVQSGYGSASIQSIEVGEEVLYVGGDRKTIRGMKFSRDIQGQESKNKSWASEHITEPGVRRIANSRDPYQVVWMPMKDGNMAGLSYEPTYNLIGWHVHDTDGAFIDSCNARVATFDYTFFIVSRTIEGELVFYLESVREIQRGSDIRYTDSYVDAHLGDPQSSMDGLDHLEGKIVAVVADGEVQEPKLVVDGSIPLDPPASSVNVGLPFRALMETLPAIAPSNVGGLASQKSWAEIGVRLLNSPPPIVNGILQEPGDDPTMVNLGWDLYATIVIEQDQPLPLTVTGVYGRLSTEDIIG